MGRRQNSRQVKGQGEGCKLKLGARGGWVRVEGSCAEEEMLEVGSQLWGTGAASGVELGSRVESLGPPGPTRSSGR